MFPTPKKLFDPNNAAQLQQYIPSPSGNNQALWSINRVKFYHLVSHRTGKVGNVMMILMAFPCKIWFDQVGSCSQSVSATFGHRFRSRWPWLAVPVYRDERKWSSQGSATLLSLARTGAYLVTWSAWFMVFFEAALSNLEYQDPSEYPRFVLCLSFNWTSWPQNSMK